MVTDRITSPYRAALAPVIGQPPGEPREGVQYRFPWIQRVSSLEVVRQEHLEREPRSAEAPADPRAYVYLQFKRGLDAAALALEALARIHGVWYRSSWGRTELAMRGDDAECTVIKLPPGAGEADVEAIAIRTIDPPPRGASVRFVRAYCLDDGYRPRTSFAVAETPAALTLTPDAPEATIWTQLR